MVIKPRDGAQIIDTVYNMLMHLEQLALLIFPGNGNTVSNMHNHAKIPPWVILIHLYTHLQMND